MSECDECGDVVEEDNGVVLQPSVCGLWLCHGCFACHRDPDCGVCVECAQDAAGSL